MSDALKRLRDSEQALLAERRLMSEALARLGKTEERRLAPRAGRLIFGLDLTGSRAAGLKHAPWCADAAVLCRSMLTLACECGNTQIARLLRCVLSQRERLSAVVFVGDQCEENPEELLALAEMLRGRAIPLFVFHECDDHDSRSLNAKPLFRRMAEISGGIYVEFKPDSGEVLKELLPSIAAFSTGGADGLAQLALPQTAEARELRRKLMLASGR